MPWMLFRGDLILPDRIQPRGAVLAIGSRIEAVADEAGAENLLRELQSASPSQRLEVVDAGDGYLAPGYVDLHVHGGAGADFMDATPEAFQTALAAHGRHGTTSLTPTTTVASHERILRVLELCRTFRREGLAADAESSSDAGICDGEARPLRHRLPRVLGAHFYGPYFAEAARGCHPGATLRPPDPAQYASYLDFAEDIVAATVAPELPGAEGFARACRERAIGVNIGHSQATFEQVEAAVGWGARHVDHLYCAMSDKTKLRASQAYPMRGGVLEATLYFDELTTEVIADGRHLSPDLLRLAYKLKGPDRLALATDCNRALDMPEGRYIFGAIEEGEPFDHRDGVGVMPDGTGLASSAQGMDVMVQTLWRQTGLPIHEAVRMASLTPARIAGREASVGSIASGKLADLLVLDRELNVRQAFVGARPLVCAPLS